MKLDILVFAAHPDDAELGCAGTLMKQIEAGSKVGIVDLTQGEMGSRGTIESRYEEATTASEIMGIHARVNLKMTDGFFEINEVNKRLIIEQIRRFQPEIVLMNALNDRHPDHGRASKLVSESCFLSGLIMCKTEWEGSEQEAIRPNAVYHYIQDYYIKPDFVVDVTKYHERKINAVQAYKTQFYNPDSTEPETPISGLDFLESVSARMMEFGRPAGFKYAEGFTAERFIGVDNLSDLI
ncbi:MAG: bacillithiol biosynthesis deacetylase BshB1 [Crocinitomicaceae bacterium]|nr:bacillithiol biosynthesis deacetylase BshB1 [Crocinitomicaceae bacterium]MDC1385222.1 bacillithiol biosynthesis deacetylase BshB1 [Crocinitomicaceae bacterium]|tara:strand:+ start:729 stop:1445 length:717 start_codon:yes stop_codon:yes gene_type:complete